jgi:hypothetical protein
MKLRIIHKICVTIIFASVMLFLTHALYTYDVEKRQQTLHKELGKFILSLLDERVSTLTLEESSFYHDIISSLSDYFDLEHITEILVFSTEKGQIIYPSGTMQRAVPQELIDKTGEDIEGEIRLEDRFGYFVRYKPLGVTFVIYSMKSDLYIIRNQLLYIIGVLVFFFALILFLIDLGTRRRLGVILNRMKACFEKAFIKRGRLLESIDPQGDRKVDDVLASYNTMVAKAEKVFKQMENRIGTLFKQRDNLKKIISLYKKYAQSETVLKISEKNFSDLESKRQEVSSLSIELVNFLKPIDELYPQVITNELNNLNTFLKNIAVNSGGIINFSYGYFINIVYGAPTPNEKSFTYALEGAKQLFDWIEERNNSDKNVSGVKWDVKMGLSYGGVVAGTVGDGYIALGLPVEESIRMLEYAKYYGVPLISDSLNQIGSMQNIKYRKLDRIRDELEGTEKEIYEIFLREPDQIDDAIKLYYHGLEMFLDGKYDVAVYDFKKVNRIFDGDNPSIIFLKRCERFIKTE